MMKKALLGAVAALALAAPASAQELRSIGVTLGSLGNPFFVQMVRGTEAKAKELGGDAVQVTAVSADYDLNKQYTQIDNFIASGVDMILVNAADPEAILPAVKRAQAAGIKVVAVDVSAAGADATVQTNNIQAGAEACQYIVDKLQGQGNVVIMNGPPVSSVIDRVKGCEDTLAKAPGITLLSKDQNGQGSREGGLQVMVGLLTANPDINAAFTINDPQAIGADLAAKQLGRTDFFITSVDGAPEIEQALTGNTLIEASSAQDPYRMAQIAVETGYKLMKGESLAETTILIPSKLITRENVGEYQGWTAGG